MGLWCITAAPAAAQQAATDQAPPAARRYWARNFSLHDVDSQTAVLRLEAFGFDVPFELQGQVSLNATVFIPFGDLLSPTAYRLEATLTSPRLTVNSVQLADAAIRFEIDDGILHLRDLRGTLLDRKTSQPAGLISGTGSAELVPLESLSLTLRLQELDLQTISRDIAELETELQGTAAGQMTFSHPDIGEIGEMQRWRVEGAVDVRGFAIDSIRLWDLTIETLRVENGTLHADGLQAAQRLAGDAEIVGTMRGDATVQLFPAGPVSLNTNISRLDLRHAVESLNLNVPLSGVASGAIHFENPGLDRLDEETAWAGNAQLSIDRFRYDTFPAVDQYLQLRFGKLTLRDGGITLQDFAASQFLAGSDQLIAAVRGSASAALFPAGPVQADLVFDDVALRHATEALDVDVPLAGAASGAVHLQNASLAQWDDETAWVGQGEITIDRFRYDDYPAADRRLQIRVGAVTLRDGGVTLEDFSADQFLMAKGDRIAAVRGSASAVLFPAGPVRVDLEFSETALKVLPDEVLPEDGIAGVATGTMQATNPRSDRLASLSDWTGNGELRIDGLAIGSRPAVDLEISQYAFDPNSASVTQLAIRGDGWQASAGGGYSRDVRHAFRFQITTPGIPTPDLYRWVTGRPAPDETTGAVAFALDAVGQENPETWRLTGSLHVPQAEVAGIPISGIAHRITADAEKFLLIPDNVQQQDVSTPDQTPVKERLRLGRVEARYELNDAAFQVERLFAEVLGGVVEGSASIALDSADPGQPAMHRGQLKWQAIDYAGTVSIAGSDFALQSTTSGDASWSVASDQVADPRAHQFDANIELTSLLLSEKPLGDLSVQLNSDENTWHAAINGTLLGGRAESEVAMEIARVTNWRGLNAAESEGFVGVSAVDVSRLFAFWQTAENVQQWRGQTDLEWTFQGISLGPDAEPHSVPSSSEGAAEGSVAAKSETPSSFRADGLIRITGLAYAGRRVTDQLVMNLGFDGSTVVVKQFTGSFAGGRLGASGSWRRSGAGTGLSLLLTGVDTSRALLVFSPSLAEQISGIASGRITLAGSTEVRASGQVSVREMRLDPFRLGTVRSAVDGAFDLGTQRWRVQFRNVAGSVARGRIRGQASLASSPGQSGRFHLDSRWELDGVDFEQTIEELSPGRSAPGKGKLSGLLTIKGRRIASVADLEGTLDGRLDGTEANAVPGLPAARNQLGAISLRNTTFDAGEIHGRFRRGTFHLRELWLDSDQLRVWADGNVALSSRRWDVDAVVATGNFEQANLTLLTLARQVSLDATLPVGVILRVNEALSDRVVYLRLSGPMSRPQVRVRAGQTLGQNAARFFLRSLTNQISPVPAPGVGR